MVGVARGHQRAEFNSDDHYIFYCGQESLRRNGVAIMVNKRIQNAVLECSLKNDRMISVSDLLSFTVNDKTAF